LRCLRLYVARVMDHYEKGDIQSFEVFMIDFWTLYDSLKAGATGAATATAGALTAEYYRPLLAL